MNKYLILCALILSSCAPTIIVRSKPEATACGAALGVKIEGYYAKCDAIEIIDVVRVDGKYIGTAKCIKWRGKWY